MRHCDGPALKAARLLSRKIRKPALRLRQTFSPDGETAQPRSGRCGDRVPEVRYAGRFTLHVSKAKREGKRARPDFSRCAETVRSDGFQGHDQSAIDPECKRSFRIRGGNLSWTSPLRNIWRLRYECVSSIFPSEQLADEKSDFGRQFQLNQHRRTESDVDRDWAASDFQLRYADSS